MNCPNCGADLAATRVRGLDVERCPKCHGLWLDREELDQLEDEVFDDDDDKGTVVFSSELSARKCPHCQASLRAFKYRLWDLQLEYCPEGHGYWLDEGEDKRVLEFMREEEARVERSREAEERF